GRGANDVRIVSVRTGKMIQTLPLPGSSGGIAMDPAHALVYVSGVADSPHELQQSPRGTPGVKGDVVHVFSYSPRFGKASFEKVISVPPPSDASPPQSFPGTNTKVAWPDRLAVSPDGGRLLVPLNLADRVAIVDTDSGKVRYVSTGNYPYGAAILRDGKTGLVSNETPGTVSVIDLDAAKKVKDIQVGPHLSHPAAIALDPKAPRAYVTVTNSDQVAVIDTADLKVERTLSVEHPEGLGAAPVDVAVTPDGGHLLVAEEGADELAVVRLPGGRLPGQPGKRKPRKTKPRHTRIVAGARMAATRQDETWRIVGRIPTAEMPMAVDVTAAAANPCGMRTSARRSRRAGKCMKVLYVSGKGLGTGPNPQGPQPNTPEDSDDLINRTQYLPLINFGASGVGDFPTARGLAAQTAIAERQIVPTNKVAQPPADTPLRPGGPIKHVFYIVRENRTYDQVMGDDERGDGDPKLALFGAEITPNAHALARRFPLIDHVYANSEASIDGHFWTAAAQVSDYVHKAWFQNYAARGRPYDFGVYAVTWPANGFLFDQAERQGISYFNYGEAVAGVVPLPDKDRTTAETQQVTKKLARSDLGPNGCYPNDSSIGTDSVTKQPVFDTSPPLGAPPGSESRADCFARHLTEQVATGSVPAFNYLVLTNDHTQTLTAGARTPRAMVADNDEGLGRIVDTISKSPIWKQSAIFVIEDDSQDGADHVDAHRIPAFVISPFAKAGAVVHTRYDFLSVIRSMELIVGMKPLGLFDELATPMYDVFQADPSNDAPYDAIAAKVPLLETNPSGTAGARAAARLPKCLDCIPQHEMDALLWKSVHGQDAVPPPPGPNAVGERRADGDD
ncbi:MAG TPA: bifunctional YncE family protein/alkaline phosphatase family protein, partial [Solirubrobacteraceae bacterium]